MESETILPCPFCGSIYTECATNDDVFWVRCTANNCEAEGPHRPTRAAAIAAHNRIASAVADRDRLTAENERLRAQSADTSRRNIAYLAELRSLREAAARVVAAWDSDPLHPDSTMESYDAIQSLERALAATTGEEPTR